MASYTGLSGLMSKHPELFILRSFRDLNIKNILYYEAELAHLECELREVEEEDEAEKTLPRKEYAVNWKRMSMARDTHLLSPENPASHNPRDDLQWRIFSRIRLLLEKYSKHSPLEFPENAAGSLSDQSLKMKHWSSKHAWLRL